MKFVISHFIAGLIRLSPGYVRIPTEFEYNVIDDGIGGGVAGPPIGGINNSYI